jgi:hypothetical protein
MAHRSLFRAAAAVLAAAVLTLGLAVVAAGTAQADTPECRATTFLHEGAEYNETPTTAPNNWVWRCRLGPGDGYVGDQAHAVWVLQRALIQCYGQDIDADGKYGGDTQEAVRNVQRFHNRFGAGLTVDGVYGPNTAAHMEFVNTQNACWT